MALAVRGGLRVTCGTRGLRQRWRPDPTWLKARSETCSLFGQRVLASTGTQHSTIHTSRLRGYGQQGMGAMAKCSGLEGRQSEELPERERGNRVVRFLATMVEHLARKSAVCKPHRMATKPARQRRRAPGVEANSSHGRERCRVVSQ